MSDSRDVKYRRRYSLDDTVPAVAMQIPLLVLGTPAARRVAGRAGKALEEYSVRRLMRRQDRSVAKQTMDSLPSQLHFRNKQKDKIPLVTRNSVRAWEHRNEVAALRKRWKDRTPRIQSAAEFATILGTIPISAAISNSLRTRRLARQYDELQEESARRRATPKTKTAEKKSRDLSAAAGATAAGLGAGALTLGGAALLLRGRAAAAARPAVARRTPPVGPPPKKGGGVAPAAAASPKNAPKPKVDDAPVLTPKIVQQRVADANRYAEEDAVVNLAHRRQKLDQSRPGVTSNRPLSPDEIETVRLIRKIDRPPLLRNTPPPKKFTEWLRDELRGAQQ